MAAGGSHVRGRRHPCHKLLGAAVKHSKTQVRNAGKTLRKHAQGAVVDAATLEHAYEVVDWWRRCHAYPLMKATMGLRSRVNTAGVAGDISQRLKRRPTIVDKLRREPTMTLDRMQDVGGCRAVLVSVGAVREVQGRWTHGPHRDRVVREYDYIDQPRASGYRGVHLIVQYADRDQTDFNVEVQLRTQLQHEWAYTVEYLGGRRGYDLKSGEGPPEILALLARIAEAMEYEEKGQSAPDSLRNEIRQLRPALTQISEEETT
jgi:ppGpp synthetase/RelA/SpoT-type nucleotidyltranferase